MKAAEMMTRMPVMCDADTTVEEACKVMERHSLHCIPVKRAKTDHRLMGIVTNSDIVYRVIARGKLPSQTTVKECMTAVPITAGVNSSIEECCWTMDHYNVRYLPVVNGEDLCVGILTDFEIALHVPKPEKRLIPWKVQIPAAKRLPMIRIAPL